MRRREFVPAIAAAAAGAEERLRIGFLGATHPHAAEKIRIIRQAPLWDLAGVAEDDAGVRERLAKSGVPILAREALLADASLRVVAVESDVKSHARDARLALQAGKHVHLEKPPSANMREFRELAALARRRNLRMQMGYMWRYHPGFQTILEAKRKGWLGDIYLVRGFINTFTPPSGRAPLAQFPGGQMFEMGGHLVDPLVRLLGRPEKVTPIRKTHGNFGDRLADNTAAMFEYPKALAMITSSALQPNPMVHRSFEVYGTNGQAILRPTEPGTLVFDLARPAGPYAPRMQEVKLPPFRRYIGDFEELAEAVRLDKPLAITPEEDLEVHEALLRASGMWS